MSLDDLEQLYSKECVVPTFPASWLWGQPSEVEKHYAIHARTHLPLGDTAQYVDTIFKWVSGVNKGTFIGAVLGDYGEGKTSFLVHVWAESQARKVLAVPPFQWVAFEEIVDGVGAWVRHLLQSQRPDLALRSERVQQSFRQQTLEALARQEAQRQGKPYDEVLNTIQSLVEGGHLRLTGMSAARLVDFLAQETEIVREAGYLGLLVLLDEPEVAAKNLGADTVQLFLFDLANELNQRQGNYGVFLSMPRNFYSTTVSRFAALTARLEIRKCFPNLAQLYGPGFAADLWQRYVQEFGLAPIAERIVEPITLRAIGQVGSSERFDLSYGPRTVISAFKRMIRRFREKNSPYTPQELVEDILRQEVMTKEEYRTKVRSLLRSPDIDKSNRHAVLLLAAFPSGLRQEELERLGMLETLRPLARTGGLVHRSSLSMSLRALERHIDVPDEHSALDELIEEIDNEYAPDRRAFDNALAAFTREVLPLIFVKREGQQLVGWQPLERSEQAVPGVYLGTLLGAFPEASRQFPSRAAIVFVGGLDARATGLRLPSLEGQTGPQQYDLQFNFILRWHAGQPAPAQRAKINMVEDKPVQLSLYFDLIKGLLHQDHLADIVGAERLTPLWTLNLLQRIEKVDLARQHEAEWRALRDLLLRQLLGLFLDQELCAALAEDARGKLGEHPDGSGTAILGQVCDLALRARYPDYHTLIRQAHWQSRVDAYINALSSAEVPLAAKRGRQPWKAGSDLAARVLGTSRTNLTGGAFAGFESLIEISSRGRDAPLEIQFHLHPLEQKIRDLVRSQPMGAERKFKREGRECWYMPVEDVWQAVRGQGYTFEELQRIIGIGKVRGSYDVGERQRERVLYCMPIEPEELKAQLRAKLKDLVEEIKEYKSLPDYTTAFDSQLMAAEIEKVADDADSERLMTLMNKEFEQNHNRLPGYFGRIKENLTSIRNGAKSIYDRLVGSRDTSQIDLPRASSPWGVTLGRLVVPNLKQRIDELRQVSKQLLDKLDRETMRFDYSRGRTPSENLSLLREAWSTANDDESQVRALAEDARALLAQVADFGRWRQLLEQSDRIYGELLELQRNAAHESQAQRLLAAFDRISQEIIQHLEVRNVTGLPSYPQFAASIEELEKGRQQYLAGLKGSYDQCKDRLNRLLERLNISQRVSLTFNPMDVAGGYEQLFQEGSGLVGRHGVERALQELEEQQRELNYARDILRTVDAEQAGPDLAELERHTKGLKALKGRVTRDWLRQVIEGEDETGVQDVAETVQAAFQAIHVARQLVQKVSQPSPPPEGEAQALYAMIPEARRVDLKELVLLMMLASGGDQALEKSLRALAELFRHNCVQITVERRR